MPFAKMDEDAAKIILDGLPVIHNSFVSNPLIIARRMAGAKIILATRFHATIFGFKLGLKVIPFAYAKKNEMLFDSIGVESNLYYKSEDLLINEPTPTQLTPIYFDSTDVMQMERDANDAINACLNALGVK
jgi:polysaccharide pyruvyl transferase WcaK-like protein